jgi:hypothetical protein
MKKFTSFLSAVLISSSVFAGTGDAKLNGTNARTLSVKKNRLVNTQSAARNGNIGGNHTAAVIFSEDFAGGIPAGWSNVDVPAVGVSWVWTTTGSFNPYPFGALATAGTSAANGYIKFDSDSAGASVGGENGVLTTTAINCTGFATVKLRFNEIFVQFAASTGTLLVSNDNSTWTAVHSAETGLAQNESTPNPNAVDIDISSIAANQATVYLRFDYVGDYDYFWMIDDVELYEPSANDVAAGGFEVPFNSCALSATEPVTMDIINVGTSAVSGFSASFTADGGTPVVEAVSSTINPGDTLSYTFTATADFSAAGVHTLDGAVILAGDADTSNNTAVSAVTASYAQIDLTSGAYTQGFEPTDDFSGYAIVDNDGDGVTFDISTTYVRSGTQTLRKPGSGVDDDNWLFTTCYDLATATNYELNFWYKNFELLNPCSLEVFVGTANDIASMTQSVVVCPVPGDTTYTNSVTQFTVPAAGSYYFGFHFYSTQGTGTSSLRLDDISINIATGLNNVTSSSVNVYPNPSNGIVNFKGITGKANVAVYSTIGQLVFNHSINEINGSSIDLSNLSEGIYSIQITTDAGVVTKSINIKK